VGAVWTLSGTAESLLGQFQELSPQECLGLLRSKRLGRVAYDDAGPVVLPVHYVIHRAPTISNVLGGATERLTAVLSSKLERLESHRTGETVRGR
jgi:nitroimidazol reductase NimA-like FMN-containing flavoprotein (pyridoxamine 5'-phosphate oxidase superfamily)